MYKRIIVKIGTSVISKGDGRLNPSVLRRLVDQVAKLRRQKVEVIIVTSGAVGTGRGLLKLKNGKSPVIAKQVFAAVGQVELMGMYAEYFRKHGIFCAQVLATKEDFRDRQHYANMKNCMENLIHDDVIPVVNENDVVAVAELMFTDNDELAGLIAEQLKADAIMILTTVEGVYAGNPKDRSAKIISAIDYARIKSFQKYVTPEKTAFGRGGMPTKFGVAKRLARLGITTHIANGRRKNVLLDIAAGKQIGTKFLPR